MADKDVVGFIGVGVMGNPMARHLMAQGWTIVAHDVNPVAMANIVSAGALPACNVRAVCDQTDVVLTSLPSPTVFTQVMCGEGGIASSARARVAVDLSTVGSRATKGAAAVLLENGIHLVDAPVSGGLAGAENRTLAVMAAGRPEVIERVRPLLEVFGRVFVVGQEAGQAQLLKLLNNMLSSTAFAVTSEAYVAGLRGGLDPRLMLDVFNAGSGRSGASQDKFPKHVLTGAFDFGFPVSSVCKDIGLAVDECQALGVPMWIGGQARQLWLSALLQGGPGRDMTELVQLVDAWSAKDSEP